MTATVEPVTTVKTVTDCAEVAWNEHGETGLGSFAALYRHDLDQAGTELIRPLLVEAWARRGYRADLVGPSEYHATPTRVDEPADDLFREVRREAACQIDWSALLDATELNDEHRTYES